ncbi:hypothetical protein H681_22370 [Pseudomonas sp. ATCC 13867]|nr:hypothetical protein H681_22370 [Pseudomonas sp. ATCC 13867]RFQ32586.1 hypothetical protein D0N87_13660 [Pseudomonas sp. ATCC 13867]
MGASFSYRAPGCAGRAHRGGADANADRLLETVRPIDFGGRYSPDSLTPILMSSKIKRISEFFPERLGDSEVFAWESPAGDIFSDRDFHRGV